MKQWIDIARYDSLALLAFFSADCAVLREDALTQNLFTARRNILYDVAGRTESPYLIKHAFAAAPVLQQSKYPNEIRIGYSPLFYTNTNKTIATVFINFLDGQGYMQLFGNNTVSPLSKAYTDSSGYKKFIVKLVYNDASADYCYTGQYVAVDTANSGSSNRYVALSNLELTSPALKIAPSSYANINPTIPSLLFSLNPVGANALQNLQRFNQDMKL